MKKKRNTIEPYTIVEMYQILGLEHPVDFQKARILKNRESHTFQDFQYLRQTGKTKFYCIKAVMELLNNNIVLFFTRNHQMKKYIFQEVKDIYLKITSNPLSRYYGIKLFDKDFFDVIVLNVNSSNDINLAVNLNIKKYRNNDRYTVNILDIY